MTQTVLILGATGRFGRNTAEAFDSAGWQVRRFDRKTQNLMAEAQGADVIVNGWNPPYDKWAAQVPGLTRQVIAAARVSGATVVVPGNVYVYGVDAPERFAPDTPHAAKNALGRIRIEMERAYRDAGVQTIVLRAGDYLDRQPSGNWFDAMLIKGLAKGRMSYPGPMDRGHAWAFLPDVARAVVALSERRATLPRFTDVGVAGYHLTGSDLAEAVGRARGQAVRVQRMAWWPVMLASVVWPLGRGLVQMRYLWSKPHFVDGAALEALVPRFQPTPLEEALRQATAHVPVAQEANPRPVEA